VETGAEIAAPVMPQIIVTAAVNDVEEWLKFKDADQMAGIVP
jgi:hypothetical protein